MGEKSYTLDIGHWTHEDYKQRITKKQMREMLLNSDDTVIFKGHVRRFKFKHVGAGIYDLSKEHSLDK